MKLVAHITRSEMESLNVVFPGGLSAHSGEEFLRAQARAAAEDALTVVKLRYVAAMSGAMRWPWSQEARIDVGRPARWE